MPRVGRNAGYAGFTVLELIIVLGTTAVIMAILMLGIRQATDAFQLRRAAAVTTAELRRAQETASAEDVDYTVEFYTSTGSGTVGGIRIWKPTAPGSSTLVMVRSVLSPEWPTRIQMPAGSSTFPACAVSIDATHECVVYKPLGYPVQDGRVRLRAGTSGSELNVVVGPATGRVSVQTP